MNDGREKSIQPQARPDRGAYNDARFWVLIAFICVAAVGGGSSQQPTISLVFLRVSALAGLVLLAVMPGRFDLKNMRVPLLMLALLALLMLLQLVPLPPGIWLALPGRRHFAEAATAAGVAQPWHSLSLTPDGTWNSLATMPIALTTLCAFAGISLRRKASLVGALIVLACASALLGLAQIAGGDRSPLYLYSITHYGSPVGFFANRNHQAALLAFTFPLLRVWVELAPAERNAARARQWVALGLSLLMIPIIMVTGSRAGIVLGLFGILAAVLIKPPKRVFASLAQMPPVQRWALLIAPVGIAALAIVFGRAIALERFSILLSDPDAELRLRIAPLVYRIVQDFFPFGTGFGSFDPIFRYYEPDADLDVRFVNRAHNDFLELAMTGGLPALLLLLAMLSWCAMRARAAFRASSAHVDVLLARLAIAILVILLLASIPDYPLRTPLMTAVATIAVGWLATMPTGRIGHKPARSRAEQI